MGLSKYRCCLPLSVRDLSSIHLYNPLTLGTQQSRHALISRGRLQSNGLPGTIVCGLAPAIDLAFVSAGFFSNAVSLYFGKKLGTFLWPFRWQWAHTHPDGHTQAQTQRHWDRHTQSNWWSAADVAIGHQTRSQINEVGQEKQKEARKGHQQANKRTGNERTKHKTKATD